MNCIYDCYECLARYTSGALLADVRALNIVTVRSCIALVCGYCLMLRFAGLSGARVFFTLSVSHVFVSCCCHRFHP